MLLFIVSPPGSRKPPDDDKNVSKKTTYMICKMNSVGEATLQA